MAKGDKESTKDNDNNDFIDRTDMVLSEGLVDTCLRRGMLLQDVRFKFNGDSVLLIVRISRSAEGPRIGFYGNKTAGIALAMAMKDLAGPCDKLRTDDWALSRFDKDND